MLYDELVPDGKYLAHYGVPKDQWSPEARARHNRNHPQKADATMDYLFIKNLRRAQDAYDEYRNDNYNRGGHRSTFGSKVDEERARRAEFSRRYEADDRGKRPTNPQKPSQGGSNRVVKPGDGRQPSEVRRRHTSVGSKDPSSYAKPGRSGRSSGSGARMPLGGMRRDWDKPDSTFNNAKKPGPGTSRSYSSKALPSKGTPGKGKPNKNTPTAKDTYTKGTYTKDTPNNKDSMGRKYSYGRKPSRSKNAHSGGGYSDRANNIYDRPTGHRTLHGGNAGPGSLEQIGANTYRRVDYENRRRRR